MPTQTTEAFQHVTDATLSGSRWNWNRMRTIAFWATRSTSSKTPHFRTRQRRHPSCDMPRRSSTRFDATFLTM
jgi:hypothetical protein